MTIRKARRSDVKFIGELFDKSDFKLQPSHLQSVMIAEENGKLIAIMTLNTVLECCFLTVDESSKKNKIESLKRLVTHGIEDTKSLGYDLVHAFANDKIAPILKKHFDFVPGTGENLVLFVE